MTKTPFEADPHLSLQNTHYNTNSSVTSAYSSMAIPTSCAAPNVLSAKAHIQSQSDPLEQRILDLIYPYRDECFADEDDTTELKERTALILCGTSHHQLPICIQPLILGQRTLPSSSDTTRPRTGNISSQMTSILRRATGR
jgi:hypothetical protein